MSADKDLAEFIDGVAGADLCFLVALGAYNLHCRLVFYVVDEGAQYGFGDVQGNVVAQVVRQDNVLLDGADAEDAPHVDNVLAAEAGQMGMLLAQVGQLRLDFHEPEGHQEVHAGGVVDFGIVVVGLHVEHLVEIDKVDFVVGAEAQKRFLLHPILWSVSPDARRGGQFRCSNVSMRSP